MGKEVWAQVTVLVLASSVQDFRKDSLAVDFQVLRKLVFDSWGVLNRERGRNAGVSWGHYDGAGERSMRGVLTESPTNRFKQNC